MKKMDLFCSSPSSTAICSTLNHRSMVRQAHRNFDRHRNHNDNPFLHDRQWKAHRHGLLDVVPCSSGELPFNPKSRYHYETINTKKKIHELRRKSAADVTDLDGSSFGSSRYLLGSSENFTGRCSSESKKASQSPAVIEPNLCMAKARKQKQLIISSWENQYGAMKSSFSQSNSLEMANQIQSHSRTNKSSCLTGDGGDSQEVVLYVSLHCKGCEEKVRKHISKMEGVKSFNIDLATKKVTIIGEMSPLNVLASVSKVKRAQFWASLPSQPFTQ